MIAVKAAILGARQIRGQLEIPQSREIAIHYQTPEVQDRQAIEANLAVIRYVGRIADLTLVANGAELPPSASAIVERRTISSPLAGLIDDPAAELARLQKRKAKAMQDLAREEAKLKNPNFAANAPAELVAEVHERIAEAKRQIEQIEEQERQVRSLK